MILKCAVCGQNIEFADGLPDGQHVRCPYCGAKMELDHSLEGIPSFRVLSGDIESRQTPSQLHVRQSAHVSVSQCAHAPTSHVSDTRTAKKLGGSSDWVLYVLLVAVICGGIVIWVHKRGNESCIPPSVDQIGRSEGSSSLSEVNADRERRHSEENAERERRKIREEEEREMRRAEKMKRDAERERERLEMAEKAKRERELREIVSKAEMGFSGMTSVFASDFPAGKRPFDFSEDGIIIVADENYISGRSLYRLTVEGNRLKTVQKVSQRDGSEDVKSDDFMRMVTNKIVLAKRESGPVWICGNTKMNELIDTPETSDSYAPLSDFMRGALPVLTALRAMLPAVKYRVTLKAKRGKDEIKIGIVEKVIDIQAIRSKIRAQLTDRKLKSIGKGVNPPVLKKFKRTVVFYDGEVIKKEISGLIKVPRRYVYKGSGQNRVTAEERWRDLSQKAEEQDQAEVEVEIENQRRMDEYRRKVDSVLRDSKPTEDEVDKEIAAYKLFIERSRSKLPKE